MVLMSRNSVRGRCVGWALLWGMALGWLGGCGGGHGDIGDTGDSYQLEYDDAVPGGVDSSVERRVDGLTVDRVDAKETSRSNWVTQAAVPLVPTSWSVAHRLARQTSFGPTESLVNEISRVGPKRWIADQMVLSSSVRRSSYTSGGGSDVHRTSDRPIYCMTDVDNCWRQNFGSYVLLSDFYANALNKPDQLRQRVAFALQQLLVVSGKEVTGTYGLRNYHNMLLAQAFGNYKDLLRKVILSPVMGDYLNHANNDKAAPNENFARELMQLFSIGLCELNPDGSLRGGQCEPTYDNTTVRHVAYALTGWTYPPGGSSYWGCPKGLNCRYYEGDMVPAEGFHDLGEHPLLSGVVVRANSSAASALEKVLESLMLHPNVAPMVSRHLIQHLVTSNPSPAYVARVAAVFVRGSFEGFGRGRRGDLAATVAAILLDAEAARVDPQRHDGVLREPALLYTSLVRALKAQATNASIFAWHGEMLGQRLFEPPSVFNYYPADYAVPGSALGLVGPAFGIHNAATAIDRIWFVNCLVNWAGCDSFAVNLKPWIDAYVADGTPTLLLKRPRSAADERLVDRLSLLAFGQVLPDDERRVVLEAMDIDWSTPELRWKQAAFLIFASPRFQFNL